MGVPDNDMNRVLNMDFDASPSLYTKLQIRFFLFVAYTLIVGQKTHRNSKRNRSTCKTLSTCVGGMRIAMVGSVMVF